MRITLHRALAELKLIDDKISKQTHEILPVGVYQKGKLINGRTTPDEFEANAISKLQAINDLIDRKHRLKSAIVKANAQTEVNIAGRIMTIAEAINYKVIIEQRKALLNALVSRYAEAVKDMTNKNLLVEQNLQKVLEATFGKDNVKISKDAWRL